MKKIYRHKFLLLLTCFLTITSCDDLNTVNNNNPAREDLLTTGADLKTVLQGGYVAFWQAVHDAHPAMALMVASDTYGCSWGNFGMQRMGFEPRRAYNNRSSEEQDYRQVVEDPWYGCLSAVSTANDILNALDRGITLDKGGDQDLAVEAAAYFLRGVSWGYLGLIFDQATLAYEGDDITQLLPFAPYQQVITAAVAQLDQAVTIANQANDGFFHDYFNGVELDKQRFVQFCHSYAARFLAQWPRTETENEQVDWATVLAHAEKGIQFNFAPEADGGFWQSYHQYVFRETGLGPFWARVDQRLIAAMDRFQPTRYPETIALGEEPIPERKATSNDARLESDFYFEFNNNFPADRGEWHFSHYKHDRNLTDPGFAGNGSTSGPMPVFRRADNELLIIEAQLRLGQRLQAIALLNQGTRSTRGALPPIPNTALPEEVERAIMYERAIELLGASPYTLWFDRRRIGPRLTDHQVDALGGLQTGAPAHLPVPANELAIHGLKPYSFGGPQDPEGIIGF
jgi:hypothetical protein